MKARIKAGLLIAFSLVCFMAMPARSQSDPPLAVPHLEKSPKGWTRPVGRLGLELGVFCVIEGAEHQTGKLWGSDDFAIDSVNGKKVGREMRIQTDWSPSLSVKRTAGRRYVLHGYETGQWEGTPIGLPPGEPGMTQSALFVFQRSFVVISIEKVDGVTVADTKPLDPQIQVEEPKFASSCAEAEPRPPIGVLGLPLGTFAVIEVQPASRRYMMASPYEVLKVNGVAVDPPRIISIPGPDRTDKRAALRGYETGEWGGAVWLPKSENPSGMEAQQGFQFFHRFNVTSCGK